MRVAANADSVRFTAWLVAMCTLPAVCTSTWNGQSTHRPGPVPAAPGNATPGAR